MEMRPIVFLCSIIFSLASCATPRPDLTTLYQTSMASSERVPVVVIPGILGSKLRDRKTKEEIWPGGLLKLLFGDYSSLALPIDETKLQPKRDRLEPFAFFDSAAGRDFYGRILKTLTGPGGYRVSTLNRRQLQNCYHFFYDWRFDIPTNASRLNDFIDQIRREHNNPDLKVDIVAHSMGGLIARYFVYYGGRDILDEENPVVTEEGAKKVRKVILLGTPNFGSITGLQTMMTGYRIGLGGSILVDTILTMPSSYQLLPHPDGDWMINTKGDVVKRNLYDIDTWKSLKSGIFDPSIRSQIRSRFKSSRKADHYLFTLEKYMEYQLLRASHFHRALSKPASSSGIKYIVFGGDCFLTPARCLLETVNGQVMVRLKPSEIVNKIPGINYDQLMLEPGDASVTKPSLLGRNILNPSVIDWNASFFPLSYVVFICEKHESLPGNITFEDNLLNILLTQQTTYDRLKTKGSY